MPLDLGQFNPPTAETPPPVVKLTGAEPGPAPAPSGPNDPGYWINQARETSHWKRWEQQYQGQRLKPLYEFPKPFYSVPWTNPSRRGETAQQMPNYSQLTPIEKSVYEWLPGFSQGKLGQALAKFGESPFGKLLSVLDVGAEFVERAGGLASQFWNAKDDPGQLQDLKRDVTAGWYAGSLASDMTNLPTYRYDEDGRIAGFTIPTDLPGSVGIAQARKDISSLVNQGATYSEALQEVRSGYYDSLGALQMRAQMYDLYQHILLDPLNIVMPYIKPIERLRVASEFASTTKWADDVLDASKAALTAAKTEGKMEGIVAVAQKTQKLTGRTATAFKRAQDAGDIEKAAKITEKLLDEVGITQFEKISLYITGKTDPLKPQSILERAKLGGLTPEARASELMTTVQDNVGSYIIARTDDVYQIAGDMRRAASGAVGPEMGHAFVTPEGRAVQGLLKGFDIESEKLIRAFDLIKDERTALGLVADVLGVEKEKVMGLLAGGDFAGVARMSNNIMDAQTLETLYQSLKGMPYSTNMFKLQLMNKLAEHTARQGVLMFGVKARGFAQKLAGTVKAAETLAFLRVNPAYFVKNALNNEFTMIGRGMGVNMAEIESIVKDVIRFESPRMRQGFGMIGDALGAPADKASQIIADASRGERGFLDKATDAISGFKPLGKLDMGYLSSKAESSASTRSFVTGYLQGWNRYFWKSGKGYDAPGKYFPGQIQDMINTVDKGIIPALDQAVGSAKHPQQIMDNAAGNLNLSMKSIMDDASAKLGYKVDEVIPEEFLAKIEPGLQDAAINGTVREYMTGVRQELQTHLDELAKNTVKYVSDKTAAKIAAEGPAAFPKIWADQMDEWHGSAIQHAVESEEIAELVRLEKLAAKPDWERINQIYKLTNSHNEKFYGRLWDRWDGTVQGMVKGAKSKGIALSDDVVPNFKELKRGWRGWWKNKRKMQDEYFAATTAKKTPPRTWDDISTEISRTYDEMVVSEDRLTKTIDQLVAQGLPPELQESFLSWRGVANQLRKTDKEEVSTFFERIKGMPADQRATEWTEHWRRRIARYEQQRGIEHMGESALMGDAESVQRLEQAAATVPELIVARSLDDALMLPEEEVDNLIAALQRIDPELAREYGQALFARRAAGRVEDITEFPEEGADIAAITAKAEANIAKADDALAEATAKVRTALGEEAAPAVAKAEDTFIPNINKLAPESQPPYAVTEDTYWFTRGNQALDGIERSALDQAAKPPLKWGNLPKEAKESIEGYLKHAQGQMGDARYASTRFAEYKRDTALLNYNRRYKFDTYASMIFPYQFWFTHSAAQWMINSVDRPAMLSTFLKVKEFMNTAGSPNQALPQRLKGAVRIGIPFLPDWMEDSVYFDPLRAMLPFDTFLFPFEKYMQRNSTLEGRTEYILNDMLENEQISQEELETALAQQSGALYLKAREMAIADDDELKFNAWDFASLLSGPHAPLQWAYNVAKGTPEEIGPFTPASRTIKGAAGLMGVDWDRSPMNLEGRVRKSLGLPAFDQWDDYRVDRMLSNMVAVGEITIDQALRAMIEREGDAYNEAIKKANFEFGVGAMGSLVGIPAKAYPEGEYLQRSLKDDYQRAWAKTEETGNYDFVNNFNDLHPEYEAKLALWKSPEERLRNFLADDIWNIWFDLPDLTKGELMEQLGQDFEEKFINEDTRSYESINLGEMQGWLKLMGGDPPGTLESEPAPIDLADPEVAWRVQVFKDTRLQYFGEEIFEIQDGYYDIPEKDKKARKAYRENNPALVAYWEWRRDWMHRNPETVPYLTEKDFEFEYSTPEAQQRAEQPQPWMTWDEWTQYMGPNMSNLMEDHFVRDYDIPGVLQERIEELAGQLGLGYGDALDLMRESILGQETPPQIEQQSQTGTPSDLQYSGLGKQRVSEVPYSYEEDDRLSDKAKEMLRRHVQEFGTASISPSRAEHSGVQFPLPESIARREEGGFKRFGFSVKEPTAETVYLHEIAHAIDASVFEPKKGEVWAERLSADPLWLDDLWKWAGSHPNMIEKEHRSEVEANSTEWFAYFFSSAVEDPGFYPDYIEKWFKAFIK